MADAKLSKPWYASVGVWGGLVAIAAPLVGALFHVTISDADMASITDALTGIGTAIGGLLAVYGRVRATHTIGSVK